MAIWSLKLRGAAIGLYFAPVNSLLTLLYRIDDYSPEVEATLDTVPLGSLSLGSAPTPLLPTPPPPPPPREDSASSTASTPEHKPQPLPGANSSPPTTSSPLGLGDIERASTEELVAQCLAFVKRMRKRVAPWVAQRMDAAYGPMPEDSAQLSYWMALVCYKNIARAVVLLIHGCYYSKLGLTH